MLEKPALSAVLRSLLPYTCDYRRRQLASGPAERKDRSLLRGAVGDHLLGKSRAALTPRQSPTRFNGGCIDSAHRARNARRGCPRTAGLLPSGVAAGD